MKHWLWVEHSGTEDSAQRIAKGLQALAGHCEKVIVTSSPGHRSQVRDIARSGPAVIPGLKTNALMGGQFVDEQAVERFGSWMRWAIEEWNTAFGMVGAAMYPEALVLDFEPALGPFYRGEVKYRREDVIAAWGSVLSDFPVPLWCYMPQYIVGKAGSEELTTAFLGCMRPGIDRILPGFRRRPITIEASRGPSRIQTMDFHEHEWHHRFAAARGIGFVEQVVVTMSGGMHGKLAFTPKVFLALNLDETKIVNTANSDWPAIAREFARLEDESNTKGETMPATILPGVVTKPLRFPPMSRLVSRAFAIKQPVDFTQLASAPRPLSTAAITVEAPPRDPEIPTGRYAEMMFGHGNGRTVLFESKRYLEVLMRIQNVDQAGSAIARPIRCLVYGQPLRSPDAFNPLKFVSIDDVDTLTDDLFVAEEGSDERKLIDVAEIPPTSLVPPGVMEYIPLLVALPDTVVEGDIYSVGIKLSR